MSSTPLRHCPGTLAPGFDTYSRACLNRVFQGKLVHHVLPYDSPASTSESDALFENNRQQMSISGVQEKFSVVLDKNKLRLVREGERGTYILKPIPSAAKNPDQMPANEHLTMQMARQLYAIETAENAFIFFRNGAAAYITKRFDVRDDGSKWAQDDFASLAGRTPQTHGENYKYQGNYLEMFQLMRQYLPAYKIEALKLYKVLLFNYLFSNGDAHFKNFSLLETPQGDYRLSPAYDLLNSRIHVADSDFALDDGLLPRRLAQGKMRHQFETLAREAGIPESLHQEIMGLMLTRSVAVERMVRASFLSERHQRSYWQAYQGRLKQLLKD